MTLFDFIKKYDGKEVDTDGAYGGQCMDLMHQYIVDVLELDLALFAAPTAYQAYKNANDPRFEKIANSPTGVPQPGDIVFWNTTVGSAGHVAVFVSGDANTFTSFDQNWPVGSKCHLQTHDYKGVAGWLHPRLNNLQNELDKVREERDRNWNLYQQEVKKSEELQKQRDESDKAIVTLNSKIESLNQAMAQDAVNDKDLLLHAKQLEEERDKANLELSGIAFQLGIEPYNYESVLKALESLKKPKEEVISYYDKLLKDIWPNLIRGKKAKSLLDRIWKWIG